MSCIVNSEEKYPISNGLENPLFTEPIIAAMIESNSKKIIFPPPVGVNVTSGENCENAVIIFDHKDSHFVGYPTSRGADLGKLYGTAGTKDAGYSIVGCYRERIFSTSKNKVVETCPSVRSSDPEKNFMYVVKIPTEKLEKSYNSWVMCEGYQWIKVDKNSSTIITQGCGVPCRMANLNASNASEVMLAPSSSSQNTPVAYINSHAEIIKTITFNDTKYHLIKIDYQFGTTGKLYHNSLGGADRPSSWPFDYLYIGFPQLDLALPSTGAPSLTVLRTFINITVKFS